jgi:hypothetical protein
MMPEDAQLPAVLRNRLKQIVDGLRGKSARVYRSRGGRLDDIRSVSVWSRHARNSEINYSINREHPVVSLLLEADPDGEIRALLKLIEQNFPVTAFSNDISLKPDSLSQTTTNRAEMKRLLDRTIPVLLAHNDGNLSSTLDSLKSMEPFSKNWPMVEEYISDKGW